MCDCSSDKICKKLSVMYYMFNGNPTTDEFECEPGVKDVPKLVTAKTSDFHVVAYHEFSIAHNNETFGLSEASEYKIFTSEISQGDVISFSARRSASSQNGIKMRFTDLKDEIRTIDSNWRCSDSEEDGWTGGSFNPEAHGWDAPSISSSTSGKAFDEEVPWMWYREAEEIFCRYTLL